MAQAAFKTVFDEAMEKGLIVGQLEHAHKILLKQGRKRFGALNPETEAAIKGIHDLERLDRMIDVLWDVASWAELLGIP